MRKAFTIVLATIAMIIAIANPQTMLGQTNSVTMEYSGSTTTNMTGNNDAALVGLDASHWSVIGNKGGNGNFPGLNKAGQIRLYGSSSSHNYIVVSNIDNATITSINVSYEADKYNAKVTVGGNEVTGTGSNTAKEYPINNSSFTITHNNNSTTQVYILSIVINYTTGGGVDRVANPTISPASCNFIDSQEVSITCATEGATIHYTTDNWTTESTYTSPFTVTETTTVKAKATKTGMEDSNETSATYTKVSTLSSIQEIFDAATSTATKHFVTFNNYVVSAVSSSNAYVTDGTKGFIIFKSGHGFNVGNVLSGTFEATLVLYKGAAEFNDITTSTSGLTVTTGGSITPQIASIPSLSAVNTGSIISLSNLYYDGTNLVDEDENIIKPYKQLYSDMAFTTGGTYNVTGMFFYNSGTPKEIMPRSAEDIQLAEDIVVTPSFTPEAGTYNGAQSITISSSTPGCTIYYTTNGSDPTTSSSVYTSPITISQSTTLKAFAAKAGCTNSDIATASYIIKQNYSIAYNAGSNGTVTGATSAFEGQTVELTITPASGYALQSLSVCKTGDSSTTVDVFNNAFTMPSFNVTVNATFAAGTTVAGYVKVTSNLDNWTGNYLIVYESDTVNVAFDGSLEVLDANFNTIPVTITDGVIEANATTMASSFSITEQNEKYAIQSASGLYIEPKKSDGTELKGSETPAYVHTLSIVENSASIKSSKNTVLRFNLNISSRRFRYYNNSQKEVQLYRYEETFVPTPNNVTVTFKSNGGISPDGGTYTQTIPENRATALTANRFTRTNYAFTGWNTLSNGQGTAYADEEEVTLTSDLSLYAQWVALRTITLATVQHGSISANKTAALPGDVIILSATPAAGYVLDQWSVNDSNGQPVSVTNNQFVMPDANVTVSATFIEGSIVPQYVLVTEEPLDWTGNYLIVNGSVAMDGRLSKDNINQTKNIINVVITNNTIDYVDSTHNASFNIAQVDGRYTIQSYANDYYIGNTKDKANIETSTTPTLTHSINFGSGNTVTIQGDDARDIRYNNGSTVFRYYSTGQKAIQLYRYTETVVTAPKIVTFYGNGGTCEEGNSYTQSVTRNIPTNLTENQFTQEGYYFTEWNTAANGSGTSYTDGQIVTLTDDLTLYAQWEAWPTITVVETEHGSISANVNFAAPGDIITLNATAEEGYIFSYWTVTYGENQTIEVVNNKFTMPDADVTVSAAFVLGYTTYCYVKVNSGIEDWTGNYLIVYENGKVAFDGSREKDNLDAISNTIPVSINNGIIYYDDITNASSFNIEKVTDTSYSIRTASGYLIGPKADGKELTTSQTNAIGHSFSIDENGNANINAIITGVNNSHLRYNSSSNQKRFRYYTSAMQSIQLYRYEETMIPMPNFVTFNGNGGVYSEGTSYTQPIPSNTDTPLTANRFEQEGYHFQGWNTEANGTGTSYNDKQIVNITSDLELYAQWQAMLTITLEEVEHGNIGSEIYYALPGDIITLNATADEGYVLSEWNVTDSNSQPVFVFNNQFIMPETDVTVSATFVKGSLMKQYVLVTETPENWSGNYLIVCGSNNVAFNGSLTSFDENNNIINVTIDEGTIEYNNITSAASFNIINSTDNTCTIQSSTGYYIGRTSTSNGLDYSLKTLYTNTIQFVDDTVQIVSEAGSQLRYNDINTNKRFRYYQSGQKSIQLYRYTETVITESEVTYDLELATGWNWISIPVEADATSGLQQLEEALGDKASIIKSQSGFVTYEDGEWSGSLDEINNEKTYMIKADENITLSMTGAPIQTEEHVITLTAGWNWIGYTLNEAKTLAEALAGFTPHEGDIIKSKNGFCTFEDGEWMGSLDVIEPGTGLMYKSNAEGAVELTWSIGQ